ncbi:SusC/RagA family TonB-linked outer membrane protein [Capnocytophaga catalasegens]|uniref:SusC/RagA family TonB-linked outer membrane protein n=1 Tax=Capnocytophaga catalasegens TaxID=1004260 RepID=A0AAV5AV81_9FLAO|nr:SusC/RagA family TonB-linked outer membrane protein [Capnocytophaga catalasegens]GIZ15591.1 SusC/RagA family TonB-linked outer membrane protein [Capnocytophaga catalasegens]GJM50190.1 SusC/RagA family TonB-linked outer membrane protein [Capnocytophaga catalasegens]GJM52047.1 SusC/RagA family TonB-linked outer membrane protein [Capnocytophaga catalasegens]
MNNSLRKPKQKILLGKWILLNFLFAMCWSFSLEAKTNSVYNTQEQMQKNKKVSGTITDATGTPLPGVNIIVKGTNIGMISDFDGNFEINVPNNKTELVFSYVGFKEQTIKVTQSRSGVKIILQEEAQQLDQVVVTALGIKRSEKSLSYATQSVSGKELTEVPSSNVLNTLAGKTAGMSVSSSGSGIGSSVKIVLRGNRSIQGNNQPLYVVDGTPISSGAFSGTAIGDGFGGGVDTGDGMAGINPEDIESINVLKGATAAALYGSQAANGVVLITTKRGNTEKISVSLTSSVQADIPYMTYKFQDQYAMGTKGVNEQTIEAWGAKRTTEDLSNDFVNQFFNTGFMAQNGVSVSGGNNVTKSFLSYQNTSASGIMPTNTFKKHNLSLRSTTSLFEKFMEIDGSIALTKQDTDHAPAAPGRYFNPIAGLYLFPAGTTAFNQYRDTYEIPDATRNGLMQMNWYNESDTFKNPYWLVNRHNYSYEVEKAIIKLNTKFNFTNWLSLQLRGSYDKTATIGERKVHSGIKTIAGKGGRYEYKTQNYSLMYGDALLTVNKSFDVFSVSATLGTSITDTKEHTNEVQIHNLVIPNLFDLRNYSGIEGGTVNEKKHKQLQSVFGTVSLGYDEMVFLDVTGRNDWSSTLPANNRSYFYPSVGTSVVFTEMLNKTDSKPSWLDFGKLRFSWTQVGNDMPWGLTEPYDKINKGGIAIANTVKPFEDLKPERSNSLEAGLNLRLFKNRLTLDAAVYKTITENQYFKVDNTSGSGYSQYYINAGKIQNRGLEVTLGFTPVQTKDFSWNGYLNYSLNENMVLSLPSQYQDKGLELSSVAYRFRLEEGQEWGRMYEKRFKRNDNGDILLTRIIENGIDKDVQLQQSDDFEYIGSINPKFLLGLKNEFSYKNFSLEFLIDGRFGGNVVSSTQNFLDKNGRSQRTADARNEGGVSVKGILTTIIKQTGNPDLTTTDSFDGKIDAETYYKLAPVGETSVYSATNIRLREFSLSYNLPKSLTDRLKSVESIRVSLIGRNLAFLYRDAPYDPEITLSTSSNGLSNADLFSIPASRSIGFSINVNF